MDGRLLALIMYSSSRSIQGSFYIPVNLITQIIRQTSFDISIGDDNCGNVLCNMVIMHTRLYLCTTYSSIAVTFSTFITGNIDIMADQSILWWHRTSITSKFTILATQTYLSMFYCAITSSNICRLLARRSNDESHHRLSRCTILSMFLCNRSRLSIVWLIDDHSNDDTWWSSW